MSERLFVELYFDEDVSVLLAEQIKARGFSALTTRDAQNLGLSDRAQLEFATSRSLALFTHNRVDFERLAVEYFNESREHFGIIISARKLPSDTAIGLLEILNSTTSDELKNQVRYI